jgi:hypothetical protein
MNGMLGRVGVLLLALALLASGLVACGLPRPVAAQDLLPTPEGQLGGRMPLPTAEGSFGDTRPQPTSTPSEHPLVGAWLLSFAEPERAPAQAVFADDGLVTFIDAMGERGVGVWQPRGAQSGVLAVVVRRGDTLGRPGQIMMLQGTIDVSVPGDTATLVYMAEPVDGSEAPAERAGPFTATGQRLREEPGAPTPE